MKIASVDMPLATKCGRGLSESAFADTHRCLLFIKQLQGEGREGASGVYLEAVTPWIFNGESNGSTGVLIPLNVGYIWGTLGVLFGVHLGYIYSFEEFYAYRFFQSRRSKHIIFEKTMSLFRRVAGRLTEVHL